MARDPERPNAELHITPKWDDKSYTLDGAAVRFTTRSRELYQEFLFRLICDQHIIANIPTQDKYECYVMDNKLCGTGLESTNLYPSWEDWQSAIDHMDKLERGEVL